MAKSNCTQVTEFTLMGFTTEPVIQVMLFQMFLLIYLVTILGSLGIITLIKTSPRVYSPMYYFLGNLAFVDLCFSTIVTPKMLVDFMLEKCVAYAGCIAQVFICDILGIAECFLLATMAYDRYVAICHPLLCSTVMSPKLCFQLVLGSYLIGLMNSMSHTMGIFNLSFCGSIDLYFCDISLLISLSTSDTTLSCTILRTSANLYGISNTLVDLSSYIAIFSTVLGICSTIVSTFYRASFFMYLKPSSENPRGEDKWAVVLYTAVTPMLNPLIYSPRNKEVKEALRSITK